jgi:hypothetical protein
MGFTVPLQGKAAHEALCLRQEAELRLLENIKRCLANKVKCDKEYATALTAVAAQGQKMDKCEELSGKTPLIFFLQSTCLSTFSPDSKTNNNEYFEQVYLNHNTDYSNVL